MTDIRPFIKYLKESKVSEQEALKLLKENKTLENSEKNLIYAYCYPRPLGDYGLPPRIQQYRTNHGTLPNGLSGDPQEVIMIVEASQTEQYGRFIKHVMHAFGKPEKLYPVAGVGEDTCAICGKSIYEFDKWTSETDGNTDPERHKLCFGSPDSKIVLCVDCLQRLAEAIGIIDFIDPGFLDWTKRQSVQELWNSVRPI
jgi:hypothetical protein